MSRWERDFSWAGQTKLHPIGAAAILALGLTILAVPRRWAIVPIMVTACFISPAQRVVVAGFDFDVLRILVLFGWARILLRAEFAGFQWKMIDTVVLLFLASNCVIMLLQHGTMVVLVNRLGWLYNGAGMYFMFRCLIRTWDDLEAPFKALAGISTIVAVAFLIENHTGRNMFAIFGGVPEVTVERAGRLRCQGAFRHPILAGCFWASVVPFFAVMTTMRGGRRFLGLTAVGCSLLIIVLTASSTPVISVAVGLLALATFAIRHQLGFVRWSTVLILFGLHLAMNKPVWHLLGRIRLISGSTAWHRFWVLDMAVENVDEWWLLGTKSTLHWGSGNRVLHDITNQYVLYAIQGGILTVILFLVVIYYAFRSVGQMTRAMEGYRYQQLLVWAVGSAILVHCASFFATSYFGQIVVLWNLHLAVAGCLAIPPRSVGAPVESVAAPRAASA